MNKKIILVYTIFGLLALAIGMVHHLRPNQRISEYYFDDDEKIGYSADGRKWVIQERFNDYDRVWQIKSDGELLYAPPKSPQRFMTRFRSFKGDKLQMSIADDSEIMTVMDSVVIKFQDMTTQ